MFVRKMRQAPNLLITPEMTDEDILRKLAQQPVSFREAAARPAAPAQDRSAAVVQRDRSAAVVRRDRSTALVQRDAAVVQRDCSAAVVQTSCSGSDLQYRFMRHRFWPPLRPLFLVLRECSPVPFYATSFLASVKASVPCAQGVISSTVLCDIVLGLHQGLCSSCSGSDLQYIILK